MRTGTDTGTATAAATRGACGVSAPRRASRRTASSTWPGSGPSSTVPARSCSIGRVAPTTVGLPSAPQGPGPRSAAPSRDRRAAVDGGPALGVDLAGLAEPLGHRQHGRQVHLDLLGPVVVLELEAQERSGVLQAAHARGEGQPQQLGQLGPDLSRLAVEGVAADQHQVERPTAAQGGRQGPGRGQGVRAGQGGVAHVHPVVGTPGHRLAQHVLGAGRAECEHGARPCAVAGQGHALGHGPAAVGVHFGLDAAAHQAPVLELERLGQRNLLGQGGEAQRRPGRARPEAHADGPPAWVSTRSAAGSSSVAGV